MKHLFILILSLTMVSKTFCEIQEINAISEIKNYIKDNSLIIWDIDDTIFTAKQELGSDRWFCNYRKILEASGKSAKEAREESLQLWFSLQFQTDVRPMEEQTASVIEELQEKRYAVMSLTTRSLEVMQPTLRQLSSLHVNMKKSTPCVRSFHLTNMPLVMYHNGILFTNALHKGKALKTFLQEIHLRPAHVVFVNDKLTHIQEIEETLKEENIPFIGLRYTKVDALIKNHNPEIAKIQLEYLGKILDDEAAEAILKARDSAKSQ